ncbi:uncharacterized protein L3040_000979 [Drepanopeziza brunnea f. sp. 'multigermtubi']|uniref:uncharacterized protein n=1 Tax=Drepanopeziza brunnea f. sp. 'multigermtubi' TaxID=698441 RepID=UPI002392EC4B|nr:hypothetical protein L3040_000979 [Drepanopeziza brunnea f. sp. 'multigermtubi']
MSPSYRQPFLRRSQAHAMLSPQYGISWCTPTRGEPQFYVYIHAKSSAGSSAACCDGPANDRSGIAGVANIKQRQQENTGAIDRLVAAMDLRPLEQTDAAVRAFISSRQQAEAEDIVVALRRNPERFPTTSLQQAGIAIIFILPTIALLVVCMRIYGRRKMKQLGWDDGLIVLAMAFSVAETVAGYFGLRTTFLGIHVQDIPLTADRSLGMKWNFIGQILYNPILAIVKSSILVFMVRLGGHKPELWYTILALNVFNIALAVSIFTTVVFQCRPVSFFWRRMRDPTLQGTCIDTATFYVATASLTIFTDVLVLALPFWIFLGLKMPLRVRITLVGVFLLGAMFVVLLLYIPDVSRGLTCSSVTVFGVLRLVWLISISFSTPTGDFSYDIRFCYSAVETNLAIITASAPALRPLLKTRSYAPRDRGETRSATAKSHFGTSSFAMGDLKRGNVEICGVSPSGSEEEIMTCNGIVKTTEVDVQYGDSRSTVGGDLEDARAKHRFDYY